MYIYFFILLPYKLKCTEIMPLPCCSISTISGKQRNNNEVLNFIKRKWKKIRKKKPQKLSNNCKYVYKYQNWPLGYSAAMGANSSSNGGKKGEAGKEGGGGEGGGANGWVASAARDLNQRRSFFLSIGTPVSNTQWSKTGKTQKK